MIYCARLDRIGVTTPWPPCLIPNYYSPRLSLTTKGRGARKSARRMRRLLRRSR